MGCPVDRRTVIGFGHDETVGSMAGGGRSDLAGGGRVSGEAGRNTVLTIDDGSHLP